MLEMYTPVNYLTNRWHLFHPHHILMVSTRKKNGDVSAGDLLKPEGHFTPPKFNIDPEKWMVGRLLSDWEGNFSGAGGVPQSFLF